MEKPLVAETPKNSGKVFGFPEVESMDIEFTDAGALFDFSFPNDPLESIRDIDKRMTAIIEDETSRIEDRVGLNPIRTVEAMYASMLCGIVERSIQSGRVNLPELIEACLEIGRLATIAKFRPVEHSCVNGERLTKAAASATATLKAKASRARPESLAEFEAKIAQYERNGSTSSEAVALAAGEYGRKKSTGYGWLKTLR